MKRCIITGGAGYIGSHLVRYLNKQGYAAKGLSRPEDNDELSVNFNDIDALKNVLAKEDPEIIVHTVAISSIAKCEKDPESARRVNVEWVKNLVDAAEVVSPETLIVLLSSDYVFEGTEGWYKETSPRKPQTVYGKTKAEAEDLVANSTNPFLIVRTSNVFGMGGNFFKFITESLKNGNYVDVYFNTRFTPTYIEYFLDSLERLLRRRETGTIHVAGPDRVSRFEYALIMARAMGADETKIIPTEAGKDLGLSPDSSLDSSLVRSILNNYCPGFSKALQYALGRFVYPYFSFMDQRGGIYGVIQRDAWKEINYIESRRGEKRGNHYHEKIREGFYIVDGRVEITLRAMDGSSHIVFIAERGDAFIVEPMTIHTFKVLEDSCWINFLSEQINREVPDIRYP